MTDSSLRRAIEQSAIQGCADASLVLGVMREQGWADDRDPVAAEREYRKAAAAGSILGNYLLARILARRSDHEGALRHALQAAEGGLAEAALLVASHYALGGTANETEQVRKWYRAAMDLGHPCGPYFLALTYQNKHGDFTDEGQALFFFREALSRGCRLAEYFVAVLLLKSESQSARTEGLDHLKAAVRDDQLFALRDLSRIYREGLYGITQNLELAEQHARRADEILPTWMERVSDT